jgi:hypothetical protein
MAWRETKDGFVEGDVVKWSEAIWSPNNGRRRKNANKKPWGKQEVTAQVIGMDDDFLTLKILRSKIMESNVGTELIPHKVGATIKKKRQTVLKGQPERLLWSEEEVRLAVQSKNPL